MAASISVSFVVDQGEYSEIRVERKVETRL